MDDAAEDISLPRAIEIALEHHNAGRLDEAQYIYEQVLSFDPANYDALHLLGMIAHQEKRYAQAVEHFNAAISSNPSVFIGHFNLGATYQGLGRLDEAQACYRQALSLKPDFAEARFRLGFTYSEQGKPEAAKECFQSVLAIDPDSAEAHYNLGILFHRHGEPEPARACYERALSLKPDHVEACYNLGILFQEQGELAMARAFYEKALSLKPDHAEASNNLGNVLHDSWRAEEAVSCFELALRLKPAIKPEFNLAQALLSCGRFDQGWTLYEHRFDTVPKRYFPHKVWSGESLVGKTVLIWGDQGIGDQIQFASMFREIIAVADRCIIECSNKLVPLFAHSFAGAQVVPRTDPPHPATLQGVDVQCSAGSLARWLRPSLESFPRHDGYLAPAPGRVAYWKKRLAALGPGPKVGFAWRSSNRSAALRPYSTAINQWGPIFSVPGVHFINLQYDECASELAEARSQFGVSLVAYPEVDLFDDLAEAAALTKALDLVIAPPTSTSILSAALGVHTWAMIYGADWQTHGTGHNPWHPTMRRFPRRWDQPWEEIIQIVSEQLKELSRYMFRNYTAPGLVPPVKYLSGHRFI